MKRLIAASLAATSLVSAHSWLMCTDQDNSQLRSWMEGNSTLSPPVIVDPAMPIWASLCHGWSRNKANPGNWIDESSNYVWNLAANAFMGETHACRPDQRAPSQQGNAPAATAAPGGSVNLYFGGNGHARGFNVGGDPGTVSVYWKGGPEMEIADVSEFTDQNKLQSAGFSADSFSYPADQTITSPVNGLVDKGNWMRLNIPASAAPGRHMMVWVWSYKSPNGQVENQWSTCFDVVVSGNAQTPPPQNSPPEVSAPATPSQAVPDVPPSVPSDTAPAAETTTTPAPPPPAATPPPFTPPKGGKGNGPHTGNKVLTTPASGSPTSDNPGAQAAKFWMFRIFKGKIVDRAEHPRRFR